MVETFHLATTLPSISASARRRLVPPMSAPTTYPASISCEFPTARDNFCCNIDSLTSDTNGCTDGPCPFFVLRRNCRLPRADTFQLTPLGLRNHEGHEEQCQDAKSPIDDEGERSPCSFDERQKCKRNQKV